MRACAVHTNHQQGQVTLHLTCRDHQVSEAELWLPPAANTSLNRTGVADLEWIEVEECEQRKGIGSIMLTAAMRAAAQMALPNLILWVEPDNVAMQALARACGFSQGPTLHWLVLKFRDGTQ